MTVIKNSIDVTPYQHGFMRNGVVEIIEYRCCIKVELGDDGSLENQDMIVFFTEKSYLGPFMAPYDSEIEVIELNPEMNEGLKWFLEQDKERIRKNVILN